MATIEELKERILQNIKNNIKFTVDSNVIVNLAQEDPTFITNTLLPAPTFYLTPVVVHKELVGLVIGKRFHKTVLDLLQQVKDYAITHHKVLEGDPQIVNQHAQLLIADIVMVPRKIVYDLLIANPDSYLNRVMGVFDQVKNLLDQGKSFNEIIAALATHANEMKKFRDALETKTIALLQTRAQALRINLKNFDYERYCKVVRKIAQQEIFEPIDTMSKPLKNVATIKDSTQRTELFKSVINDIINKLSELKNKKYEADIQHIAHVLALDLENVTSDSDQLYLIELHARRRVA